MKVLHTSDWHLGKGERMVSYLDDQKHFVNEICEIVEKENVKVVVISGDVYDRSNPNNEAIKLYDEAITKLCLDLNTKVFIVAGNHDSANLLSTCNELLKSSGLYVAGVLDKNCNKPITVENTDFYMIPWISNERARYVFDSKEINTLDDAYNAVCEYISENLDKNKTNICLSHSFVTNSEVSGSERQTVVGLASQISGSHFDEFDYVALGHIHRPQDVGENMRYSGTPMAYSFSEINQEKSVTVFDTVTKDREIIKLHPLHNRILIKDSFDKVKGRVLDKNDIDAYKKIEVTDKALTFENISDLSAIYNNILELSGLATGIEHGSITLSLEDLNHISDKDLFINFYNDQKSEKPSDNIMKLMEETLDEVGVE